MKRPFLPPQRHGGFTLTELIVAVSVLTLLTGFVAQLVNNTTIVTTHSRKHSDADSQARLVFDRMAGDFARMLKRSDVDYLFCKQIGNDRMFFYSEAPAYYDGGASSIKPRSSMALLGYRINSSYQIERLGKQLNWGGDTSTQPGSIVFLTYPAPTVAAPKPTPVPASLLENNWPAVIGAAPAYDGADNDYHVLADQVCRMEFCFQMKDGSYVFDPAGNSATVIHSLKDVTAIVVGLVVLDATSQEIVDISKVSGAFDDPTDADLSASPPVLMGERWRRKLFQAGFATTAGIPQAAASQIRIYEKSFALNRL
ncbi:MAG: prepilin-type N-terminal cleavage/methylation domain-containing protein [Chthoniobacter sp.]|nr:prepilin-type N-terminal cleavage/methylation domain-containing protein [Chthoniobacter sp.]